MLRSGRHAVCVRKMGNGWFLTVIVSLALPVFFKFERLNQSNTACHEATLMDQHRI